MTENFAWDVKNQTQQIKTNKSNNFNQSISDNHTLNWGAIICPILHSSALFHVLVSQTNRKHTTVLFETGQ